MRLGKGSSGNISSRKGRDLFVVLLPNDDVVDSDAHEARSVLQAVVHHTHGMMMITMLEQAALLDVSSRHSLEPLATQPAEQSRVSLPGRLVKSRSCASNQPRCEPAWVEARRLSCRQPFALAADLVLPPIGIHAFQLAPSNAGQSPFPRGTSSTVDGIPPRGDNFSCRTWR